MPAVHNGPSRRDIDEFFAAEVARLNAAIADLFALAEEQYNTNEQLQRELNHASSEIGRLANVSASSSERCSIAISARPKKPIRD